MCSPCAERTRWQNAAPLAVDLRLHSPDDNRVNEKVSDVESSDADVQLRE